MAFFWACDLVRVKSYVVLLLFALFKLCGAACLFLTADHICGPVLTRTQVHLPASSSFAPERVQRSEASAWSAAASPGVQNMCQRVSTAARHFFILPGTFYQKVAPWQVALPPWVSGCKTHGHGKSLKISLNPRDFPRASDVTWWPNF